MSLDLLLLVHFHWNETLEGYDLSSRDVASAPIHQFFFEVSVTLFTCMAFGCLRAGVWSVGVMDSVGVSGV